MKRTNESTIIAIGMLIAITPGVADAAGLSSLRHGTYVQADTACAEASDATTRTFTGRGFDSAKGTQCVAKPAKGRSGNYVQSCVDHGAPESHRVTRSNESLRIRILSATSYMDTGTRFRLCPGVQ